MSRLVEERIEGAGGLRIFLRSWRPDGAARGVVAICHGFNSHGAYYRWTAEQLAADGFAVYALDLRGRGQSDGERYYVDSMDEYIDDLHRTIRTAKSREPGLPVFLIGHSAGGVVSCTYALDYASEIAGLVCESFAFQVPAPDFALAAIKGLSHLAPHAHVLRLKIDDFSRDPNVTKAMHEDPLVKDEVQPTKTVAAMVRADERLKRDFPLMRVPVLIIHGSADKVTRPEGSRLFHDTAGSADKTLKIYDGYAHDPLNDLGKEAVLADITRWIADRLPRS